MESKGVRVRVRLSTLFAAVIFVAMLSALLLSYETSRQTNREAADIARELYRKHLLGEYSKPYGSLFPSGLQAIVVGTGDVLDLRTKSGRRDLLVRIESGATDFRVIGGSGQVMQYNELSLSSTLPRAEPLVTNALSSPAWNEAKQ